MNQKVSVIVTAIMLSVMAGCSGPTPDQGKRAKERPVKLLEVNKIWDEGTHNAFTDLIRFKDEWFCTFREGQGHVDPDGVIRVIRSKDGNKWESAALITSDTGDLRDPKLSVTPDNKLMIVAAERENIPRDDGRVQYTRLQSYSWFSGDGINWSDRYKVGHPDFWLWRVTWHNGIAYCIAKGEHTQINRLRFYKSKDGKNFETYVETLLERGHTILEGRPKPSETTIRFMEDGTAHSLTHTTGSTEFNSADHFHHGRGTVIGTSRPPYKEWEWKSPGKAIGGPNMIPLPDGRIVAGVRLYVPTRTSLAWLDPVAGTLEEFLVLPSGGDNSYPGLVWHDDMLWVSYYSGHEGKTSIYLARVKF